MKRSIFNGLYSIIILILALPLIPTFDAEKTIHMNFKVNTPADLVLENEFGDINIMTWEKSEIDITVEIQAQSGIDSHAKKFVKETKINFNQEGDRVFARTKPGTRKFSSKWLSWFAGDETYEINYTVYIPDHINLDLDNKHGDITIDQYDGDLEVDLEYGNMRSDFIAGSVNLDIKHSDVKMKGLGNGKLNISYSRFASQRAGNLYLKTTNSDLNIGEALNLTAFSKYDHYIIGSMDNLVNEGAYDDFEIIKVRSLDMTTRFTEVDVDLCEVSFQLEMVHGEAGINHISSAFSEGTVDTKYTAVELTFEGMVNMELTTDHTMVDLGDHVNTIASRADGNKKYMTASIGKDRAAKQLVVTMEHGSLDIR